MTALAHKETLYLRRNYKENMQFYVISAAKIKNNIEINK